MKKYIIANWKNHPDSLAEAQEILEFTNDYLESLNDSSAGGKEFSLVICPPFVFTEEVGKILKTSHLEHNAVLGVQDIVIEDKTTLTGEVSGPMLQKLGVQYVIIGHSERRWKLGESNETVNQKLKTTLRNGFIPIVCIGERVRDDNFEKFLEGQITGTFEGLSADEIGKCIIAYEPVGAISTNPGARPDTPASALESIYIIKEVLAKTYNLKPNNLVLYGGSVNSKNVRDFLGEEEIDGVLVGGASVNKEEFVKILEITASLK
ncbi:MAG: hypothetical protein A3C61_00095 [Candidatus Yanofskybacteria bacterium RIFCSPHIGHO2_02_FULL_39_10]|uniref:Triosephosphate isomerase n=1 Tax=Candidatus Yanofskybacteria bacterium RIFCSPHIGHO2_02_FULL_39_10 TaxID=1802674 RepID=A0A1F8FB55_9BACT|nr:MAG: hypothetical protein A3C61_00095 [Candidatus Yanofskybacteria bacterium RIFCSPHIGHO2_02_FULL_39_10]